MANKDIWNALKQPPATALKEIQGGRLRGMTDVSPQWRYETMTEQFGPVGVGWRYEIIRTWSELAPDNQRFAFAEISLFFKNGETWSEAIPGTGGSLLVANEKGGLHANDEAYKMAVTDALSVAMKMLGVAADVYAGRWDGAKYTTAESLPSATSKAPESKAAPEYITSQQATRIGRLVEEKKLKGSAIGVYIAGAFGKAQTKELLKAEASQLIEAIEGDKITVEVNKL